MSGSSEEENYSSDSSDRGGQGDDLTRDLTPEEMDKLVQLQDMTHIDDILVCRALLESKGWDLEATAREHLGLPLRTPREEDPHRPVHAPEEAPNARVVRMSANRAGGNQVSILSTFLDWGVYLVTFPVTFPLRLTLTVLQSFYGALSGLLGWRAIEGRDQREANRRRGQGNPLEDVRQFGRDFEAKFGRTHPQLFSGSYSQALEEAKKELRFLVVYLHSPDHEETETFCSRTLVSQTLIEFLENNNIIFWGCSVNSGEGYRVSQALRESTYPFLAVIVLRQNRMMIVGRVEGAIDPDPLVERLEAIVRDNEAFIVAARMEREERTINQNIREEQDAAFQETLRQDQEKERKKKEAEERKRMEEEEERRREKEERDKKERIRQMKIDLVTEIPEEPEVDHPEVVKMLIKLPGGQRLERRFLKSQSLKYLYLFVFCHPDSPDEFDITTNFPKKVLECKPELNPPSFEEAGLGQSTMLFVNDLEA